MIGGASRELGISGVRIVRGRSVAHSHTIDLVVVLLSRKFNVHKVDLVRGGEP
jgi:hypothetical protein